MANTHPQLDALIALGVELVDRGLVLGSGGNLSLRAGDTAYITRSGARLDHLSPDDFLPVRINEPYHHPGKHPRPSLETPMHLAVYHTRVDARFVVHCHPVQAIAWAMQAESLPACTPDFVVYVGPGIPVVPYLHPGSEPLASAVTQALEDSPALLLANHGVLVTGDSIAKTLLRTLLIDETAHICLLAAAAGKVQPLAPHQIAKYHA
jgi:L-fuculose-phosphate aldolase